MATRASFSLIYFAAQDDKGNVVARAAMTPDGGLAWQAGLKPAIWSFKVPYTQLDLLGAPPKTSGRLEFYDRAEIDFEAGGASGGEVPEQPDFSNPDVVIEQVQIVDIEPRELAIVPGQTKPIFTEFRVCMADFREGYVAPRGGRLALGEFNPSEKKLATKKKKGKEQTDADDQEKLRNLSFADMIRACLKAMGLDEKMKLPAGVDKIDPPLDVKWFGNHAPTELEKLLKRGRYLFVPKLDGTAAIEAIGTGDLPQFREGDALPELVVPSIDRRGKIVVVTSYPTRVFETLSAKGPNAGGGLPYPYFNFVMQDPADGEWKHIEDVAAGNLAAIVQGNYASLPTEQVALVSSQAYRCIALIMGKASAYPSYMVPLVTHLLEEDGGAKTDLYMVAKTAIQDPVTGLWSTSKNFCKLPATYLASDDRVYFSGMIGKMKNDNAQSFVGPDFLPLDDGEATIKLTFERVEKDKEGKWRPAYFQVGFRKESGRTVRLSDADTVNALGGSGEDCIIITDPRIKLRVFNGVEQNRKILEDGAQSLADPILYDSGNTVRHLYGRGFQKVELSGLVSKVSWEPDKLLTLAEVANWWTPGGALDPAQYQEQLDQDFYPNQNKTETSRQNLGAQGDRADVLPLGKDPLLPPAMLVSVFPVKATVDNGTVAFVAGGLENPTDENSPAHTCLLTYKLKDIYGNQLKEGNPAVDVAGRSPAVERIPLIEYVKPPADSIGLAYRDSTGKVQLWMVGAEQQVPSDCEAS